jgi:hypothetical protein
LTPLSAQLAETVSNYRQEISVDKQFQQHRATPENKGWQIVAQEEMAGSSPVGHLLKFLQAAKKR